MNAKRLAAWVAAASVVVLGPAAQANDDANEDLHTEHDRRGTELRATRINRPVVLVDSTGRVVARVAPGGQFGAALFRYRQDMIVVPLGPFRLGDSISGSTLDWGTSYIVYGGFDCTGPAYLPLSVFSLGGTRAALPERRANQWVLLLAASTGPITLPPQELRSTSMGGMNCFNSSYQSSMDVHPVQEVIPLDPVGIAPFHFR